MPSLRAPTELAVALDFPSARDAEKFLGELDEATRKKVVFKVGLELFGAAGPRWVQTQIREGLRVFLDLKLHDIPNTVARATERVADLGVEWLTLHCLGGKRMLEAAQKVRGSVNLLGVTVLTSHSESEWKEITGGETAHDSALKLAEFANDSDLSGVVCSFSESQSLRKKFPALSLVIPGIRFAGESSQDQSRVSTPGDAARAGARLVVMGRSITQAKDPKEAMDRALKEFTQSLKK